MWRTVDCGRQPLWTPQHAMSARERMQLTVVCGVWACVGPRNAICSELPVARAAAGAECVACGCCGLTNALGGDPYRPFILMPHAKARAQPIMRRTLQCSRLSAFFSLLLFFFQIFSGFSFHLVSYISFFSTHFLQFSCFHIL